MGIYGMGQGQTLGLGTFNFDRICPNRYLLDSLVNKDGVLPGRYALVEYDRPVAVILNFEGTSEEEGQIFYKLTYLEKQYDIIKGLLTVTAVDEDNINFSLISYDNPYSEEESPISLWQILVCQKAENEKYNYYIASYPFPEDNTNGISTIIGSELKFLLFIKDNEEQPISITPYTFNRLLDKAYVEMDNNLTLTTYELWDSTAWLKIVNTENEYEYVNVANLNVLTPTFEVDTDSEHRPITTFADVNGTFNVPNIRLGENAKFLIKFPPPMDINISVDTSAENSQDSVTATFNNNLESKDFILKLPTIGNAIAETNTVKDAAIQATTNLKSFIQIGSWPDSGNKPNYTAANANTIPSEAGTVWQVIKDTYEAINATDAAITAANNAADAADAAREGLTSNIVESIGTNNLTVSIGNLTSFTTATGVLNIETTINSNRIITAAAINTLWGPNNNG